MWILMQSVGEVATLFPVHGGFVEVRNPNLNPFNILLICFI